MCSRATELPPRHSSPSPEQSGGEGEGDVFELSKELHKLLTNKHTTLNPYFSSAFIIKTLGIILQFSPKSMQA